MLYSCDHELKIIEWYLKTVECQLGENVDEIWGFWFCELCGSKTFEVIYRSPAVGGGIRGVGHFVNCVDLTPPCFLAFVCSMFTVFQLIM